MSRTPGWYTSTLRTTHKNNTSWVEHTLKPRLLCPQRLEVGYTSATVIVTVCLSANLTGSFAKLPPWGAQTSFAPCWRRGSNTVRRGQSRDEQLRRREDGRSQDAAGAAGHLRDRLVQHAVLQPLPALQRARLQPAMGPCVAMAAVGLASYAWTAACRSALVVKMVAAAPRMFMASIGVR